MDGRIAHPLTPMPRWTALAALLIVLLLSALIHGQWIANDEAAAEYSLISHVNAFQQYRYEHGDPSIPLAKRLQGVLSYQHYTSVPPLLIWITWPIVSISGPGLNSVRAVAVLCLLIYLIAVYLLAGELGGRWAAVAAVCLAPWFANVTLFGHIYGTKLLASGMVCLTLWSMLKSDNLQKIGYSILTGIFLLLAFWSERVSPIVYLAAPLGLLAVLAIYRAKDYERPIWKSAVAIALPLTVPCFVMAPWIIGYIEANSLHNVDLITTAAHPQRDYWYYYLEKGPRIVLGYSNAILLGFAIVLTLIRKSHGRILLLCCIAFPLAFFSAISTKDFIYLVGLSAPAAVLMGIAIAAVKSTRLKMATLIVFVFLGAMQSIPRVLPWPWLNRLAEQHPIVLQFQPPDPDATLPEQGKPIQGELADLLDRNAKDDRAVFMILYTGDKTTRGGIDPTVEAGRLQMTVTMLRPWSVISVLHIEPNRVDFLDRFSPAMLSSILESFNKELSIETKDFYGRLEALHLIVGAQGSGAFKGYTQPDDYRWGGNVIVKNLGSFSLPPFAIDPFQLELVPDGSLKTSGDLRIQLWHDMSSPNPGGN